MARKVILNVEDNEANRKIVRYLFESKGYKVIEAMDGEEGVRMAEQEQPDIILMDVQLPKLSGYEATLRIKANPALRDIPVIAVTSFALGGDDEKAMEAGCDDYIAKPFKPRDLLERVEKFLSAKETG
ncbi:MAG: response regulator [Candidatus Latescibacteria bacterium]|nr:response regulator [Candidatus Latescibacterota bacterium]